MFIPNYYRGDYRQFPRTAGRSSNVNGLSNAPINVADYFEEKDYLVVEAEDFYSQERDQIQKWYRTDMQQTPKLSPDIN